MNEKGIFEGILRELRKDWIDLDGKNIKSILEGGLNSYTANVRAIEYGLNNIPRNQEDFDELCAIFEKEILILDDKRCQEETYCRALEKLDKIIKNEDLKEFEDIGTDLFCNFYLAYLGTAYEDDSLLCKIGDIGLSIESGNADKNDWRYIKMNLRQKIIEQIKK